MERGAMNPMEDTDVFLADKEWEYHADMMEERMERELKEYENVEGHAPLAESERGQQERGGNHE